MLFVAYKVACQSADCMYRLSDIRILKSVFIFSEQEVNPTPVVQLWVQFQQSFFIFLFNCFGSRYVLIIQELPPALTISIALSTGIKKLLLLPLPYNFTEESVFKASTILSLSAFLSNPIFL